MRTGVTFVDIFLKELWCAIQLERNLDFSVMKCFSLMRTRFCRSAPLAPLLNREENRETKDLTIVWCFNHAEH